MLSKIEEKCSLNQRILKKMLLVSVTNCWKREIEKERERTNNNNNNKSTITN